jgi:hypothetical protein
MAQHPPPVEYAIYFVAANEGNVERIQARHYAAVNGLCAGCVATPTEYPCQIARIAELAQQHPAYISRMAGKFKWKSRAAQKCTHLDRGHE